MPIGIYKRTKQGRINMGKAHKGKTPTKGKHWRLADITKERIGAANKGKVRTKKFKDNLSKVFKGRYAGEKHPNWRGGVSAFGEYTTDWTETLRRSIRERDHYTCQMPGCNKQQGDIAHDVHHIDYDKTNCNPNNLVTLCHSCHSKTNFNRKYWIKIFI